MKGRRGGDSCPLRGPGDGRRRTLLDDIDGSPELLTRRADHAADLAPIKNRRKKPICAARKDAALIFSAPKEVKFYLTPIVKCHFFKLRLSHIWLMAILRLSHMWLCLFFKRFGLLFKGRVKHGVRHCFNEFLFLQHIYGRNYYTILKLTPWQNLYLSSLSLIQSVIIILTKAQNNLIISPCPCYAVNLILVTSLFTRLCCPVRENSWLNML